MLILYLILIKSIALEPYKRNDMLETNNSSNQALVEQKSDLHCNIYMEKLDINIINSCACSSTSIKANSGEIERNSFADQLKNLLNNEREQLLKIRDEIKPSLPEMPKDKISKNRGSVLNKTTYCKKTSNNLHSRRKPLPVVSSITNASTKAVLFERNVEIKDLESKVKYLQNKIKELENENKTLQSISARQERDLKKFKEGVADIPSLLRLHKEETKVYESTLSNVRRELRDCQKDLKIRNDALLKKESHINKLNVSLKGYEKNVLYTASEMKELKAAKKDVEEENKLLLAANESLKFENENLHKKIKNMILQAQNVEENFAKERVLNQQLKEELDSMQKRKELTLTRETFNEGNEPQDKHVNCRPEKDDQCEIIIEDISDDCVNSERSEGSSSYESKEKIYEKESLIGKTKNDSTHSSIHQQSFCKSWFKDTAPDSCATGINNLKALPPLKKPSKKYSQNQHSDFSKEDYSSFSDLNAKNETKKWHSDKLANYFQSKLTLNDSSSGDSKIPIMNDVMKSHKTCN